MKNRNWRRWVGPTVIVNMVLIALVVLTFVYAGKTEEIPFSITIYVVAGLIGNFVVELKYHLKNYYFVNDEDDDEDEEEFLKLLENNTNRNDPYRNLRIWLEIATAVNVLLVSLIVLMGIACGEREEVGTYLTIFAMSELTGILAIELKYYHYFQYLFKQYKDQKKARQ